MLPERHCFGPMNPSRRATSGRRAIEMAFHEAFVQ
jgi:hypothetical protein